MEAGAADTAEREDIRQEPDPRRAAVERAAASDRAAKDMSDEQQTDALAWLIGDDNDDNDGVSTKGLRLNVGTYSQPHWIPWTIKNVDREVLKQLQREARGTRAQRRGTSPVEVDPEAATLRIVSRGTLEPDLDKAADAKSIQRAPDPDHHRIVILKHRFRNKPGLLDQLATEIFDLSGYDDEAIQEAKEVEAAGN